MSSASKDFESIFPQLVDDVIEHCKQYNVPQTATDSLRKNLYHNAVGGKCNRGMSVVDTVSILLSRELSKEEYFKAASLGWMVELLQAFFLVSDDIMDGSKTRRGNPCWYLMPNVGMSAINDAFLLESAIYLLLKKYYRDEKYYLDLLELFHEITLQTELGQSCDLLTAPEDNVDLNKFTMEKFSFIVIFKTAYYSFYLPVALALYFCDSASMLNLRQAREILIPMGEYFQAQDDYLDNFANPNVLGKIGTDIQDNKCSWLINQALKIASSEQRAVLNDNYGRKDKICEARVKEVYQELRLDKIYDAYEEEQVDRLKKMISQVDESEGLKKKVFDEFLRKIYKRNK